MSLRDLPVFTAAALGVGVGRGGSGKGGSGKGCELPLLQHLGWGKGQCCIVVTLLLRARLQHWGVVRGVLHCCSTGEW